MHDLSVVVEAWQRNVVHEALRVTSLVEEPPVWKPSGKLIPHTPCLPLPPRDARRWRLLRLLVEPHLFLVFAFFVFGCLPVVVDM